MRPLELADSSELAAAYVRNRAHLAPWEPARSDEFFTEAAQAADLRSKVAATAAGSAYSLGLFDGTTIVGRFNLSGIVRGPFQNAGLGYWVDAQYAGRGLATAVVQAIVRVARDDLGLHRVEASTLLHNHGSQRVLRKAGFEHIGMAPSYLRIAGTWQDHNLYQVILHR
ncbi:GNAT family N-acetyltransferase [Plantibacter sp. CFBP 8798]|nr:GNAT family N-acetyltransferase [Plantibacter sp. CFBP 8798]MBD8465284.1 GNAT family N-acetyltransferase [Plantibacter sp. CFBP 8798]